MNQTIEEIGETFIKECRMASQPPTEKDRRIYMHAWNRGFTVGIVLMGIVAAVIIVFMQASQR